MRLKVSGVFSTFLFDLKKTHKSCCNIFITQTIWVQNPNFFQSDGEIFFISVEMFDAQRARFAIEH